ncbi:hypothetical protein CDL15_Pgr009912 [Punica granatum]|uniref:Uncharacterized protein n=1 Tax=Punica granatum TaxID=22663 RepID=A0A218WUL1_PUNGR|nr:hypothetical protein CDL15_Pgr009912 [Punica granatum]
MKNYIENEHTQRTCNCLPIKPICTDIAFLVGVVYITLCSPDPVDSECDTNLLFDGVDQSVSDSISF